MNLDLGKLITEAKFSFMPIHGEYRMLKEHGDIAESVDKKEMERFKSLNLEYPSKKIIAEVEIVDCLELDDKLNKEIIKENNIAYGSKYRTGYAWKLGNVKKLKIDKTINGKLGLWNYESSDFDKLV